MMAGAKEESLWQQQHPICKTAVVVFWRQFWFANHVLWKKQRLGANSSHATEIGRAVDNFRGEGHSSGVIVDARGTKEAHL